MLIEWWKKNRTCEDFAVNNGSAESTCINKLELIIGIEMGFSVLAN